MRKLRLPIKLEHIFSAPFLRSVLLRKNLLKKYAPKIRSAAVNICCKFLFGNACVLYGNAYKLRARLSHPTEQRADLAASHPPPMFAADINSCTLSLCASFALLSKNPLGYANGILLRFAKHAHESLNTSSPLHFLGRFCYAKTYLRNTLRRYVQQPLISAANSSSVTLVSSTVTLTSCEPGSHSLWRREPTSQHPTHHP